MSLGSIMFFRGGYIRARGLLESSVELARSAGDWFVVALSLGFLALGEQELGDVGASVRLATQGQDAARACAEPWAVGPSLSSLAYVALRDGDLDRARRLHEECLELSRQQGDRWSIGIVLFDLALLCVVQQRYEDARALCVEGIELNQEFGDLRGVARCLGILSGAEAADGHALRAARLRGAMEGLLDRVGAPLQMSYHKWIGDRSLELMRQRLGDSVAEAALAEGRSMSLPQALALALGG